jgi:hypothetical protein
LGAGSTYKATTEKAMTGEVASGTHSTPTYPDCHAYISPDELLRVSHPGYTGPYLSKTEWAVYERVSAEWLWVVVVQFVAIPVNSPDHYPVWMLHQFNRTRFPGFSSFTPLSEELMENSESSVPLYSTSGTSSTSSTALTTSAPRVATNASASSAHVFPPLCERSNGQDRISWAHSSWSPRSGCFTSNATRVAGTSSPDTAHSTDCGGKETRYTHCVLFAAAAPFVLLSAL